MKKVKYRELFVLKGQINVLVVDKKGKTTGTAWMSLNDVWIKIPTKGGD
jgi:hypothetical protein